jgi:hypothetical protein
MDTEGKRREILKAYTSASWRQKVLSMPEDQVIAVYLRLKKSGKI